MPLNQLRREIERQRSLSSDQVPLVSVELFFTGNDDPASIGCNLADHPGIEKFRDVFLAIRTRADVHDVLMAISDEMEGDEWPFSDKAFVVTSAPTEDVRAWTAELQPDEVLDAEESPPGLGGAIPNGMRCVTVWWD